MGAFMLNLNCSLYCFCKCKGEVVQCVFLKKLLIFLYSERVKMEVTAVEEKCDRRIELLTQSIKKTRKRARIERIEEDDEEWVPSVFLHAEQTKVQVTLV